ncbi:MAG: tetratricopeptide repeat protein [Actinomycetota bacterium]|nr:tetratricopeptide repeat protein [Actinomycetota bacterium]
MKKAVGFKFVASALVLGLTMVGCKPGGYRVASTWGKAPQAEEGASRLYAAAQHAVQKGDFAEALTLAERAVELAPRDAGYRMLLADLYLKNGRFLSADTAFSDVLSLDTGNSRAALSRALALIAQGKTGEASIELDRLSATAAPADVGLAFALAGQPQRAIEMLEPAARAPEATGRVRQNLALAYALAGEWQKARTVAAQDLSPAELGARLEQWAAFTNPSAPHTQVAALLGVTPVADAGQPIRLALAPSAQNQAFAAATVSRAEQASVGGPLQAVPAAPVSAPAPETEVMVAVAEVPAQPPVALAYEAPEEAPIFAAVTAPEPADLQAPLPTASSAMAKHEVVQTAQVTAAVKALVQPAAHPTRVAALVASAPIKAFDSKSKESAGTRSMSRYVVQIGAYRSPVQVEKAWSQAQRRYRLAEHAPLSTTVSIPGKGVFHRLAVSGFQAPADAARACQSIRGKGGACFVRPTAGDAPARWAARGVGRSA